MKPNITDYIYDLVNQGEHQQQDFKFEISDARKIAKTLSAFSNTQGGRLYKKNTTSLTQNNKKMIPIPQILYKSKANI